MRHLNHLLRSKLGSVIQGISHRSHLMQLVSSLQRLGGAVALMYHSVADERHARWIDPDDHVSPKVFEAQIGYLARHRKVTSLEKVVTGLRQGKRPPSNSVIITFDDGYLDNLTVAAPILEHYGLTATVFLPTGYIDRGENQWIDQAYAAFKVRTKSKLNWANNTPQLFDLDQPEQNKTAYRAVCRSLLAAGPEERRRLLANLNDQLVPSQHPPRLTMNWEEVQTLVSRYRCFEIGGHSVEHTDLTSVTADEAKKELTGCAKRIKEMLGSQPRYFSFSYNRSNKAVQRLAAEAGFEATFGRCGFDVTINSKNDLFDLPRIEAPPTMDNFDLITYAANTGIWRRLGQ